MTHDETENQGEPNAVEGEAVDVQIEGNAEPVEMDPLAAMTAERDQWKDKALRAKADYDNLQKRVARYQQAERDRVKARVLEDFLRVYEYLSFARKDAEANAPHLPQGVLMVAKEFDRLLEDQGVQPMGAIGEPFDATRHEAVAEEAVEGVAPGAISKVIQVGYLLGDKVLRYAKVAVAPS